MKLICSRCHDSLEGRVQHASSLYCNCGNEHLLCAGCAELEEKAIEQKGTNYIPELLVEYQLSGLIDLFDEV